MSTLNDDITRQISFAASVGRDHTERKTIYPIPEEDLGSYLPLGGGSGQFLGHILHMAFMHVPEFFERAAGYRIMEDRAAEVFEAVVGQPYFTVVFYEKKPS
jgi:hypothetical protein